MRDGYSDKVALVTGGGRGLGGRLVWLLLGGGLGGPDSGFGLEGGPGEPEVVAVDYGG